MGVNPTSRFQPVETATMAPGTSFLTKNHIGPFIDTGKQLAKDDHFWGRVYLSYDEIREMAAQAGMFDKYEQQIEDERTRSQTFLDSYESGVQASWDAGYAAGRAENLDDLADQLVDRMRARVDRNRADAARPADAGEDAPVAAPAAGAGADASVGEESVGVSGDHDADRDAGGGARPRGSRRASDTDQS